MRQGVTTRSADQMASKPCASALCAASIKVSGPVARPEIGKNTPNCIKTPLPSRLHLLPVTDEPLHLQIHRLFDAPLGLIGFGFGGRETLYPKINRLIDHADCLLLDRTPP